jgi:hypothetical protein
LNPVKLATVIFLCTAPAVLEEAMRSVLVMILFVAGAFAQSKDKPGTVAPPACASRNANFDVKLDESQHALMPPEPGKARVYFIQDLGRIDCLGACLTTKIGLDGTWIGANQHNSYFSVSVAAGEHHLCANPQSRFAVVNRVVALAHFTAEPGKVYFFRTRTVGDRDNPFFDLDPLDSDQAEYLIAAFPLSVSQPKR